MASARLRCALGSAGVPTTTAELCPDVVHLVLLFSEDVAMLLRCPLLYYFSQRAELRSYVVHLCTTFLRERSYAPTSSTLYQIFSEGGGTLLRCLPCITFVRRQSYALTLATLQDVFPILRSTVVYILYDFALSIVNCHARFFTMFLVPNPNPYLSSSYH